MTTLNKQHGFTLVELAIVMTIIGLLIGGILKGQELIQNARATATIAQVRSYEAATTTFRDTFAGLPGDMSNASQRLPGCTAACDAGAASANNSIISDPNWSATWGNNQALPSGGGAGVHREAILFWTHLLQADLITGTSIQALTVTNYALGVTNPTAPIGGGFVVGYANGTQPLPGNVAVGSNPSGHVLAIVGSLTGGLTTGAGTQALTPAKAALIDRKMDDGRPTSGFVQAYGVQASCVVDAATSAYAELVTGRDCGLVFRIQ
ncbi:MAG: prepilin-type N-terminal cleavage/methylation domain-containing protein [Acetobacteraceae bacterium]